MSSVQLRKFGYLEYESDNVQWEAENREQVVSKVNTAGILNSKERPKNTVASQEMKGMY